MLDRKFTQEEIDAFNARRQIMNAPNRKWIWNEYVYTPEEFLRLVYNSKTKQAPWKQCTLLVDSADVIQKIRIENIHRPHVEIEPFQLKNHADVDGLKYGVKMHAEPGWSSL